MKKTKRKQKGNFFNHLITRSTLDSSLEIDQAAKNKIADQQIRTICDSLIPKKDIAGCDEYYQYMANTLLYGLMSYFYYYCGIESFAKICKKILSYGSIDKLLLKITDDIPSSSEIYEKLRVYKTMDLLTVGKVYAIVYIALSDFREG